MEFHKRTESAGSDDNAGDYQDKSHQKTIRPTISAQDNGPSSNQDDAAGYFGDCPICHKNDGYLNVGNDHWFFCVTHKNKWCIGANLFSSAMDETLEQQRQEQEAIEFDSFAVVEPFRPPSTGTEVRDEEPGGIVPAK